MSWSPLVPLRACSTSSRRDAPVSVGVYAKSKRSLPALLVVLRPYLLPDAPSWVVAGNAVKAMIGGGPHEGMVRLEPDGVFKLGRTAANAEGKPVLQLRLPLPPSVPEGGRKAVPVEFDYHVDWIELTLPAWGKASPITPMERGTQLAAQAAAEARRRAGL